MNAEVKKHVAALAELLQYANSRNDKRWAHQSTSPAHNGVFGHAYCTLRCVLEQEYGNQLAEETLECVNWGGCSTWCDDIWVAVEEARRRIAERNADYCIHCEAPCAPGEIAHEACLRNALQQEIDHIDSNLH